MKDNPHCLASIRANYPHFSDKEKLIADYILRNPENIIHSTINQLADDLGVADSTIFRFCKRIGFKGYQAMKIALASEIVTPLKDIHEQITEDDDIKTVAEKVFRSNIKTIEETLHIIDQEALSRAVNAILGANKVEFYGNGGSMVIALDAYHKFIRSGIPVATALDSHMQIMSASQLTKADCAILISHSGSTKDILEVMKVAKDNGATTIAITNFAKSPLSKEVDIALYTVSEETDYRSEALSSRIAQLSIIDALFVNVLKQRKEVGQQALKKMRKAISVKRI